MLKAETIAAQENEVLSPETITGNHRYRELQQWLRQAKKIADIEDWEGEASIGTFKKQLKQGINLLENHKYREEHRYKQLSDLLKQWLQILEKDEKAFINKTGHFKNDLEAWFNELKTEEAQSKVEDHAKSGDSAAQENEAFHSEAITGNRRYQELQQWLQQAKKVADIEDWESEASIDILKKQLEQGIGLLENHKYREEHRYKQLSDLLKQWLQILEKDEKTFANEARRFKNELEAWFNKIKAEDAQPKVEDHAKSGDTATQENGVLSPEAIAGNRRYQELQQWLRQAKKIADIEDWEGEASIGIFKKQLKQGIDLLENHEYREEHRYKTII